MADPKSPAPNFPTYRGLGGGGDSAGAPGGTPGAAPGPGRGPMPGMPAASSPENEGSKLIVGRNIRLKGEIEACDTLVVEGYVEASMSSRIIEIAEGGTFKGDVDIDSAHVRGKFEGNLTARERLNIYSTGKVSGHVRYGQIQVEAGGEIAGDTSVWSKDSPSRTSAGTSKPQDSSEKSESNTGGGPAPAARVGAAPKR